MYNPLDIFPLEIWNIIYSHLPCPCIIKIKSVCLLFYQLAKATILRSEREYCCRKMGKSYTRAALLGHVDCLKYYIKQNCNMNSQAIVAAAIKGGHTNVLDYLKSIDVIFRTSSWHEALVDRNLKVLNWLNDNFPNKNVNLISYSVKKDNADMLEFVLMNELCMLNTSTICKKHYHRRLRRLWLLIRKYHPELYPNMMIYFE